jgi:hypothetical protein
MDYFPDFFLSLLMDTKPMSMLHYLPWKQPHSPEQLVGRLHPSWTIEVAKHMKGKFHLHLVGMAWRAELIQPMGVVGVGPAIVWGK